MNASTSWLHDVWSAVSNTTRKLSRLAQARWLQFSKSTLNLSRETAEAGTTLDVSPTGHRHVVIGGLRAGYYKLVVRHKSRQLHEQPADFISKISTSLHENGEALAIETGLPLGEDGKPTIHLGGGQRSGDHVTQFARFELKQDRDWVCAKFISRLESPLEIENLALVPDVINMEGEPNDVGIYVKRLLEQRHELLDAEIILYADISLNVVDGSSVWLSSMLSALAANGKTLIFSKQNIRTDIIWSNVKNQHNILLLSPGDFGVSDQTASPELAISLIRELDARLPKVRRVVMRGLKAATLLCEDRQFRDRSCIYLTDFYEIEDGVLTVSAEAGKAVSTIATQAGYLLTQTNQLGEKIAQISGVDITAYSFPPPIPDNLPKISQAGSKNGPVRIGYAGKITPQWGVDEMLDWSRALTEQGVETELHIVANRISDGVGKKNVPGFGNAIRRKIEQSGSTHYADLNRDASMQKMAEMHFVWCYRPPILEDNTLEVSTKLIEMVGAGAACLCYPSAINRELLGEDYPYFIRDSEDLAKIIERGPNPVSPELASRIRQQHSLAKVSARINDTVLKLASAEKNGPTLVVAGHDFKFIDPYISHLKAHGHTVYRDRWEWGGPNDLATTRLFQKKADIILCEWGLANAVWHSNNKREGTELFVRIHLQEINERARKFGFKINKEAVDGFIFVEEGVRTSAIEMFDIPREKTRLIPNFLLDDEYASHADLKHSSETIRLGMIGITPQRKRFDLAVDLLGRLIAEGYKATLAVKGPRPEELDFMHAPGRVEELKFYNRVYERIETDPRLSEAISFAPWGNDVAAWYRDIDFILSPSDFESFHYALADGILAGCSPLIWPWEGAADIYHPDWVVAGLDVAVAKIKKVRELSHTDRLDQAKSQRTLLVQRFGHKNVFERLTSAIMPTH